jgi:hypothetical protein
VARVWTGGCIIRAALLEKIQAAFRANPDLINLLTAQRLSRTLQDQQNALRTVVSTAAGLGLPAPALMTALSYWDAYRSGWLPARISEVCIQFRPVLHHTFPATILRCVPITGAGGKGALGRGGAYRRGADPECGSRNLQAYARRLTAFGWEISEIDGHAIPEVLAAYEQAAGVTTKVACRCKPRLWVPV